MLAFPLLVLDLTGSAAMAGVVGFARLLPWLLFSLPAGVVADRVNRKRLMLTCDAVSALVTASLVVALVADRVSFGHIVLVAFAGTGAFVFFHVAETGAIKQIVPEPLLPEAVARNEVRTSVARVAGPPLGGFLFGLGRAVPFAADLVSYLASFIAVSLTKEEFQEPERERSASFVADIREGVRWLWAQPFLRSSEILISGSNFAASAAMLAIIVAAREEGASSAVIGLVVMLPAAAALLGALAAPAIARRLRPPAVVLAYGWIAVPVVAALAFVQEPLLLGAVYGVWIFCGPVWNTSVIGYRIALVPDHLQSRVKSLATLTAYSTLPLGALAGGILIEELGTDSTFLLLAGWLGLLAVAGLLTPSLRTLGR